MSETQKQEEIMKPKISVTKINLGEEEGDTLVSKGKKGKKAANRAKIQSKNNEFCSGNFYKKHGAKIDADKKKEQEKREMAEFYNHW